MKQLFSFLFSIITVTAFATVHTVSNNPATIAQFNTIQAAVNASNSGDTIYVHGSPISYDNVTITGSKVTYEGNQVIIAKEVTKGDLVLKLRDDSGYPLWSGWRNKR